MAAYLAMPDEGVCGMAVLYRSLVMPMSASNANLLETGIHSDTDAGHVAAATHSNQLNRVRQPVSQYVHYDSRLLGQSRPPLYMDLIRCGRIHAT